MSCQQEGWNSPGGKNQGAPPAGNLVTPGPKNALLCKDPENHTSCYASVARQGTHLLGSKIKSLGTFIQTSVSALIGEHVLQIPFSTWPTKNRSCHRLRWHNLHSNSSSNILLLAQTTPSSGPDVHTL